MHPSIQVAVFHSCCAQRAPRISVLVSRRRSGILERFFLGRGAPAVWVSPKKKRTLWKRVWWEGLAWPVHVADRSTTIYTVFIHRKITDLVTWFVCIFLLATLAVSICIALQTPLQYKVHPLSSGRYNELRRYFTVGLVHFYLFEANA